MKIAIISGKGGTGKTTVAVNLAALYNQMYPEMEVVLADLDVEEPNSGLYLEKTPVYSQVITREIPEWDIDRCGFCGYCSEVCKFNAIARLPDQVLILPELCHSCYACIDLCPENALSAVRRKTGSLVRYSTGMFDFVEARLDIGEPSGVHLVRKTKEYLDLRYDRRTLCILDGPPGAACPAVESVKGSDFVIIVTEPTPLGLHDLRTVLDLVKMMKLDYGVVINKSMTEQDPVLTYCVDNEVPILEIIRHRKPYAVFGAGAGLLIKKFPAYRKSMGSLLLDLLNRLRTGQKIKTVP